MSIIGTHFPCRTADTLQGGTSMITRSRRRGDRWVGVVTSLVLLGLITGVMGLQSARVRGHIPYLHRTPPTYKPTGVVLSLGQPTDAPVASAPDASATPDATTVAAAEPTVTTAPTLAPTATTVPTTVAAAATSGPTATTI